MPVNINFTNRKCGEILSEIRSVSSNPREQGNHFELLFQKAALLIPELEVKSITTWAESRISDHLSGIDDGIDLVAETTKGSKVAIQCKFYAENHKVSKSDIKDFIAAAEQAQDKEGFSLRWFVATSECNNIAEGLLKRHGIRIIDFREHLDLTITDQERPTRKPWKLQQEAIDAVHEGFIESGHNRGKLIMACGTGKTFTALRIAEKVAPGDARILFIAPSIALVAQARREWLRNSMRQLACTVICSDKTAGRPDEDIDTTEISCEVTTVPEKIAADLTGKVPKGTTRVCFCTYQSLNKLCEAQHKFGAPKFDLALVDEAHRTTGYLDDDRRSLFQLIHTEDKIKADKRLYMTATPRIYDTSNKKTDDDAHIVDMNNADTYGTEFYRLTFKKSVDNGLLCDYRVIALGITEDSMSPNLKNILLRLNDEISGTGKAADEQALLSLGAIALAINGIVTGENTPGVLLRTIAYASNIRRSMWFAQALTDSQVKSWITRAKRQDSNTQTKALSINAEHLDGRNNALHRNVALRRLNNDASTETPQLITNAKLFTEGIDVPALNAIAFLDPRQSKVDTIQAVGRVMRRDDDSGKTIGYIVVPVILPPGANLIDTLNEQQSRFKTLGAVLRALQSHDERLYTELTERLTFATMERDRPQSDGPEPEDYTPVQGSLLDEEAKQAIYAQIAKKTGIAQRGKIIADAIAQAIEIASRLFMQECVTDIIARTIGTPGDNEKESCKTAALLIANACIMHKRLEETGNLGVMPSIENANRKPDPISVLRAAWEAILIKDYEPIFQDACALLANLPHDNKSISTAIKRLIQCAIDNATSLNDLGFDHAGPLYHKVLGNAQSDGAFYTKNISAYLLAGLAFDDDFIDWSDPDAIKNLKIVDPACGTGTLLMAALQVIKRQASKYQSLEESEINLLHRQLVENSIYGFDINKYSVQLAACNLTIGAPNTDYGQINLHTLQHGPVPDTDATNPDNVRHGTLEKLLNNTMEDMLIPPPELCGTSVTSLKTSRVTMPDQFDVVIYNPPFTETSKQGKKHNVAIKKAMGDRLRIIRSSLEGKDISASSAINKGSIQPYFTPLANGLVSKENGKLAKIIPATMCISENGRVQRKYIANNFHVDLIVTSHDPKHINFSENTKIHECLVIGSRNKDNNSPTRFIQLAKYPNNVEETDELVRSILHNVEGGGAIQRCYGQLTE